MLRPIDARIVIKKQERQEQTESGIILPDTVNEQSQTAIGEVVAVGPGSRNMMTGDVMPMDIKVGDSISILSLVELNLNIMEKNLSYWQRKMLSQL